jgi:hypothetical protein
MPFGDDGFPRRPASGAPPNGWRQLTGYLVAGYCLGFGQGLGWGTIGALAWWMWGHHG